MMKLVLETVLHTVLLPGTVIVGLPYVLLSSHRTGYVFAPVALRVLATLLAFVGVALGTWCTWHFLVAGRGTPNPLDPPKFLVRGGPYQTVRNPMYVAVGLIVASEALFFGSAILFVYLCVVMIGFHLFVVLYEEPTLSRLFGSSYGEYRKRVPRWLPRAVNPALERTGRRPAHYD